MKTEIYNTKMVSVGHNELITAYYNYVADDRKLLANSNKVRYH